MECELEHSRTTPDDSDKTRNDLLTEPYTPPIQTVVTNWDTGTMTWDNGAMIWRDIG
jgi:hypothetical protein